MAPTELEAWLAPVTPAEFVHEYWGRKPLFVKGNARKYAGLFDAEMFRRALAPPGPYPDDFLRASFDRKTAAGTSAPGAEPNDARSSVFRATIEQAVPLFSAGATLCASQMETRVPTLAPYVAAIKRQLGFIGRATFNAYLSPAGSGFNWHFDSRIASTLQIEGSKIWRYTQHAAIAWPRSNGTLRADGTAQYSDPGVAAQPWETLAGVDESDVTEVLLEPGDLLVLPAGVWHEACGGSGGSLALNLSFTPIPYTLLVRNLLDQLLTPRAEWRGPAPLLHDAASGVLDASSVAAIGAELTRAAEVLARLNGDSAEVIRLWQSLVQNPNPLLPAPPTPAAAPLAIEPQQRLRVRPDGNVSAMLADGGTRLCLTIGTGRSMELTGPAMAFVQRLLVERAFVAGDARTWSDGPPLGWDDVAEMLTSLQREGLIVAAP